MHTHQHAVHRTILVVDVEGFGDRRKVGPHQVVIRSGLYEALRRAFHEVGIPWGACHREDRGDGCLVLAPPEVPKDLFTDALPAKLGDALRQHNAAHLPEQHIRLRMAVHAGEVRYDDYGVTSTSINLAFRLLDAHQLKAALATSPGVLALIASSWFFDEVIRHSTVVDPAGYRRVRVAVKETVALAWISTPDHAARTDGDGELPVLVDTAPGHGQLVGPSPTDRARTRLPTRLVVLAEPVSGSTVLEIRLLLSAGAPDARSGDDERGRPFRRTLVRLIGHRVVAGLAHRLIRSAAV
ncbi:MAG TPA: hypothetical protein VGX25_24915 [Actinophytocola sp.]|uniref:hypothetical protein n=1 Tax=Actinophytocola sp. TaxID=1872138 RepID=UPI002DDD6B7B|nr:hypothetical protein [Actinophytocola sp.]HEV2782646.1 hypothetical protein [Actinophytocola sp.]